MAKKTKAPKERNIFAVQARFRKSGAHQKSKKAIRRKEKVNLKKDFS